jgi:hypothetical protein
VSRVEFKYICMLNSLGADISSLAHRKRDRHDSIRVSFNTCKECIKVHCISHVSEFYIIFSEQF